MRRLFFLLLPVFTTLVAFATHNRAGEITYRHLSGYTYEITITTYTYTKSYADRNGLLIFWGDGTSDSLSRKNGPDLMPLPKPDGIPDGEVISGKEIKVNIYTGTHTYPGPSQYRIFFEDPNRNEGVKNIPNSVNIPFYVETILFISPFLGDKNTSPILTQPPIDDGCVGRIFVHNPGAVDMESDSLAYELSYCKTLGGNAITGYLLPTGITLNPVTGDFVWNSPQAPGEYNFAILIKEFRYGYLVGLITRDMQVTILECNHYPPVIAANDTCVEAGTFLSFPVTAYDPDGMKDSVTLSATGLPFLVPVSPAQFPQPSSSPGSVTQTFSWNTLCSHVKKQPYTVVFKAEDNGRDINNQLLSLVDMKAVNITVVAPAPKNTSASPSGERIIVTWDPSPCSNATCYKIYRRAGSQPFIPGYCETGVPSYLGYVLAGTTSGWSSTVFVDDNNGSGLVTGINYCYRIVACFPDGAESYSSTEICTQLKKDIPVITNVSVEKTDAVNGKILVAWSKPTELDSSLAPPFHYLIYRSEGFPSAGTMQLIDSTVSLSDTIYTDTYNLNTADNPFTYRIELYGTLPGSGRTYVGKTQKASSVFLSVAPSDNKNFLSWNELVPWANNSYVIYRQNKITPSQWDSVGMSIKQTYTDSGLANGTSYCYFVKSVGNYTAGGFVSPIENKSQEKCGAPEDNVLPCAPQLTVIPDCIRNKNSLLWNNPNNSCSDDVLGYNLYYTSSKNGALEWLTTLNSPADTFYLHDKLSSIAGCYLITALDSAGNESAGRMQVCVDNCPAYTLPNIYSPDGDGFNDLFVPFPYRFIESVDINIYNRWGQMVFSTSNPDVKWNGNNAASGKECPAGVYYYVCDVHEIHLDGIQTVTITGFVHLVRNRE